MWSLNASAQKQALSTPPPPRAAATFDIVCCMRYCSTRGTDSDSSLNKNFALYNKLLLSKKN